MSYVSYIQPYVVILDLFSMEEEQVLFILSKSLSELPL